MREGERLGGSKGEPLYFPVQLYLCGRPLLHVLLPLLSVARQQDLAFLLVGFLYTTGPSKCQMCVRPEDHKFVGSVIKNMFIR